MSTTGQQPRSWREPAVLLAAAVVGYAIKLPFGLLATRYLGGPGAHAGFTPSGVVLMALQLAAAAGLAVYRRTPLPGAPWLRRRLGGDAAAARAPIWRPALVGVAICLLVT